MAPRKQRATAEQLLICGHYQYGPHYAHQQYTDKINLYKDIWTTSHLLMHITSIKVVAPDEIGQLECGVQ